MLVKYLMNIQVLPFVYVQLLKVECVINDIKLCTYRKLLLMTGIFSLLYFATLYSFTLYFWDLMNFRESLFIFFICPNLSFVSLFVNSSTYSFIRPSVLAFIWSIYGHYIRYGTVKTKRNRKTDLWIDQQWSKLRFKKLSWQNVTKCKKRHKPPQQI